MNFDEITMLTITSRNEIVIFNSIIILQRFFFLFNFATSLKTRDEHRLFKKIFNESNIVFEIFNVFV